MKLYYCLPLFAFFGTDGLILSKSKIQMCENRGLHGKGDPQNLVDGKSCERKMVVLMSVTNNQKEGTEKLHATVSRVRDESTNEYARLYNPFMITISKSPVLINYPYYYTGDIVNNLPYEEIKRSAGSGWVSDSSKSCYDQWQAEEKEELKPTCGYQYHITKVKKNGVNQDVKKREWDSQGFCCHCTGEEKQAYLHEEAQNFKRSGMTCKLLTTTSQASAHCMRYDPLWYIVYRFTESYRDFTIHVRAYDQVEKIVKNKTVIDYVNGGEIILSPSHKSGVGKFQRIIANFIGDFAPVKSYPVLTERYFLIPKRSTRIDPERHPQVKDGISKYLILPMSYLDTRGGACNKIGVTYSSFKNQAAGGKGFGCQQKKGYCLMNQPHHFWVEDNNRVNDGKSPEYFPGRYGKLSGIKKLKSGKDSVLSYELEEDHVSLITLQISADDIIFVYNRATGEIVRAAVSDFEALSLNGKLQVEVLNTGYVTASFHIGVPWCSEGIHKVQERSTSIDPQQTQNFVFDLKTTKSVGTEFFCKVRLFDAKRALLSERNITFSTTTPCVCGTSSCKCECTKDGGVKCTEMSGKFKINPNMFSVTKSSGGMFGNVFKSIANGPKQLVNAMSEYFSRIFGGGLWESLKWLFLAIVVIIIIFIMMACCGPMICQMCFRCCKFRGKWGTKNKRYQNDRFSDSDEDIIDKRKRKSNYRNGTQERGKKGGGQARQKVVSQKSKEELHTQQEGSRSHHRPSRNERSSSKRSSTSPSSSSKRSSSPPHRPSSSPHRPSSSPHRPSSSPHRPSSSSQRSSPSHQRPPTSAQSGGQASTNRKRHSPPSQK